MPERAILVGQPLAKLGAAVNRFGEILRWFDSSHESWPPKLVYRARINPNGSVRIADKS